MKLASIEDALSLFSK